jgi:hypothetical protein
MQIAREGPALAHGMLVTLWRDSYVDLSGSDINASGIRLKHGWRGLLLAGTADGGWLLVRLRHGVSFAQAVGQAAHRKILF